MVDKIDLFSNFDIENNLTDCSTDENLSDLSLSDTSSENGTFEECNNESSCKVINKGNEIDEDESENHINKKLELEKQLDESKFGRKNDISVSETYAHQLSYDRHLNSSSTIHEETFFKKQISMNDFDDDEIQIFSISHDEEDLLKPMNLPQNDKTGRHNNKLDRNNLDSFKFLNTNSNEYKHQINSSDIYEGQNISLDKYESRSPKKEINESQNTDESCCANQKVNGETHVSVPVSEADSEIYENESLNNLESLGSLNSKYKKYVDSPKTLDLDYDSTKQFPSTFTPQNSARSSNSTSVKNFQHDNVISDEKRFQNLQEEINLLNILMFEAENKTEKCGSLYNSFTNEINNNFANRVVDDCTGSLVSLVDGASSKFDAISVKSELLFSEYGKSESNFDISESHEPNNTKNMNNSFYDEAETKSVISVNENVSVDSNKTTSECTVCRVCKSENSITENNKQVETKMSVEDRIVILWNQIIKLKCSLKNLQLNLKEQQMETLMQINEFLINQNMTSNNIFKTQNSSSTLYNGENERKNLNEKLSNSSLLFTENNKIREDLALNNLKIALIECNLLSSTASSLINSIPKYENPGKLPLSKSDTTNSSNVCCCNQIKSQAICLCSRKIHSKSDRSVRIDDTPRIKRQPFSSRLHENSEEIKSDRKVKSHEEIGNKYHEAKYCLSESAVFEEISPRACI